MTAPRSTRATLGRAAALIATAAALLASVDPPYCYPPSGSASFEVETDCGPPGVIALSFAAENHTAGDCYAFLEAPGANAHGLPEQGEIITLGDSDSFDDGDFALVGSAPVAGAMPPRSVERICRFSPTSEPVLEVTCTGNEPEAECSGTVMRLDPTGGGT